MSFHINKNGEPAKCHATVKDCPLGGTHFDSMREAVEALNQPDPTSQSDPMTIPNEWGQQDLDAFSQGPDDLASRYESYFRATGTDLTTEWNKTSSDASSAVHARHQRFDQLRHGLTMWEHHEHFRPQAVAFATSLLQDHFPLLEAELHGHEFGEKLLALDYWNKDVSSRKPRIERLSPNGVLDGISSVGDLTEEWSERPDFQNMVKAFAYDKKFSALTPEPVNAVDDRATWSASDWEAYEPTNLEEALERHDKAGERGTYSDTYYWQEQLYVRFKSGNSWDRPDRANEVAGLRSKLEQIASMPRDQQWKSEDGSLWQGSTLIVARSDDAETWGQAVREFVQNKRYESD